MNSKLFLSSLLCLFSLSASAQSTPLTEEEAVKEALQNNPDLKAAIAEVSRANLAVEIEENRFRSNFAVETKYSHQGASSPLTNGLNGVFGNARDAMIVSSSLTRSLFWGTQLSATLQLDSTAQDTLDTQYGIRAGLSVVQPLQQGFGEKVNRASLYTAQYNRSASEQAKANTASALIRDVKSAYWELWYAQGALSIQQKALETVQKQAEDAQKKVDAGAIAPVDALSLQTEQASIEEALAAAQAEVKVRSLALSRLMGRGGEENLVAVSDAPPAGELPSFQETTAMVEANSFELKQLSSEIDAAQILEYSAKDKLRPALNAIGQLEVANIADGATSEQSATGFIGLRLELPLNNTARKAEAQRASLGISVAEARFDAAKARISQQVSSQLTQISTGMTRLTLSQKTAKLAASTVEAEQLRFEVGASTALDLIRAQQQQREAELRVVRIQVDLALARLALDHLTGALLLEDATRYAQK